MTGEPQIAVVGDTFPVGCKHSEKIVYYEAFEKNADAKKEEYNTECGMYEPGCGLDNLHMTYGHDEYLYHVMKDLLPEEALYIIRYHSFYPLHQHNAYSHLLNDKDRKLVPLLRAFQKYDLYSKEDKPLDVEALRPYYQELVAEFLPPVLNW